MSESVVSYQVSSFEPHEYLDTDGCYITGRVHSGTRIVNASPSDLDELDDFPRSQVWGREKASDFINRSAQNNYQLSDGRYVPEAYSAMLRIAEGAGFRFAVYKEGLVELWTEVATAGPVDCVPQDAGIDTSELNEALLHELDHGGDAEAIGDLLARGANPNHLYDDGCSALYVAAQCGYSRVARLLIDAGADIGLEHHGATPLHMAAQEGHADIVRLLLDRGADANASGPSGASPLWCAMRHPEVCEALITAGADVDQPHPVKGFTPLCYAAEIGNLETAKALISAGADVNYCITDGLYYYSPLAFAVGSKAVAGDDELQERINMIGFLADNGAQFEEVGDPVPLGRLPKAQRVEIARCDSLTAHRATGLLEAAGLARLGHTPEVLDSIAAMDRPDWS